MSSVVEQLVDVARLDAWLGERLPTYGESLSVQRISLGASNEILALRRGVETVGMLRRPPLHHHDPEQAGRIMLREARVLAALAGSDVPHPRVLLACADPTVIGACFYVMEQVQGFTPMGELPSPFRAETETGKTLRRAMSAELADALGRLALVDWRARGLDGFGKPAGFLDRQVERWLGQLAAYRFRDLPGLDETAGWLRAHQPPAQAPAIMHGDYQWANVMFTTGAPARLAAVVDWEQSTIGDPLLDLGWLVFGWGGDSSYVHPTSGFLAKQEVVERWVAITGRDVTHLGWYEVLARFKLACVLEGSYARWVQGRSDKDAHRRMGDVVLRLLVEARELASR